MNNNTLRFLVKTYYDYQLMRVRIDNRLQKKKDGEQQKINEKTNYESKVEDDPLSSMNLDEISGGAKINEDNILKQIETAVKSHPLWEPFFEGVKGCGILMAAVCLSEFDIYKANNVSKMYAFAGLSPGMTRGRKWNAKKTEIILSDTMVRQDRRTPGFLCPYNQMLRAKLIGVLGSGMIKAKSPYSKIYYDLHVPEKYRKDKEAMEKRPELAGRYGRLDISEEMTIETKKGGKVEALPWKDCSDAHRNRAAIRKMIKIFLYDLYIAWRTIEGLPVRNLYEEEYLGKKHSA
jgi:hypothetical protein